MTHLLSARNVTKRFGGLVAVNDLTVEIEPGQIYAVIGPNGAGKTTFFNLITGFYKLDEGLVEFDGQFINGRSPDIITKLGISRTYQNIRLFSNMSAIENILVGQHPHFKTFWAEAIWRSKRVLQEEEKAVDEAIRLLNFVGLRGQGAYHNQQHLP